MVAKRDLIRAINKHVKDTAFDRIKTDLSVRAINKIHKNFEEPRDWGKGFGRTQRANGEVVTGSVRNIEDLGILKNSVEVEWRGDTLYASADTSYDKFVRYGFVTRSGNIVPGRDYFDISELT